MKSAILEFFKRLTGVTWERSYDVTLLFIRCTLAATLAAVIISDLTECRTFSHYWQVLPDPGGQCRQGYAQLITMASCNVITDLLLILFPVPIILRSTMPIKRKIRLVLLFSLSFGVIAVTLYRVPQTISRGGNQTYRSLLASVELLFATTAANALVLGSFVRDRGVKKKRFKYGSFAVDSLDQSHSSQSRRPTVNRQWGSDEDLVRDLGLGVDRALRERLDYPEHGDLRLYTPAPVAKVTEEMNAWRFPKDSRQRSGTMGSDDSLLGHEMMRETTNDSTNPATPRRVAFFDIGGLLSDGPPTSAARDGYLPDIVDPVSPHGMPSPAHNASTTGQRRGSTALLQDMGAYLARVAVLPSLPVQRDGRCQTCPPSLRRYRRHIGLVRSILPLTEGPSLSMPVACWDPADGRDQTSHLIFTLFPFISPHNERPQQRIRFSARILR